MEGGNYIVSWCFGHLVELADASSYDERYAKWRYDDLPIVPESWMFEVTKDKAQQFKVLSSLMKDKRVTELVCATDAGREGELIFRLVYNKAGCTKPFKRLWISSLEDSAIREGFRHLRDGKEYDRLYEAALSRSKADWIVGINCTRLFTTLYQIQTKFRDEIRPRFGLLRSREFVMKDAYSFHSSQESLQKTYDEMYDAYGRICERCGLDYRPVVADGGQIGGSVTCEFHALAEAGEDDLVYCPDCDYAANNEAGVCHAHPVEYAAAECKKVETPGVSSIESLAKFLGIEEAATVKAMVGKDAEGAIFALFIPGDHELNEIKAERVVNGFTLLTDEELEAAGLHKGSIGPKGLPEGIKVIGDVNLKNIERWVVGANEDGFHFVGAKHGEDFQVDEWADLSLVMPGDACPKCGAALQGARGIEVSQVFQLGDKYSKTMGAVYSDENGVDQNFLMGCYGVGVSRTLAAIVEQHNDEDGIIWPMSVAPAHVCVIPLTVGDEEVFPVAERIAKELAEQGIEVVLDDRDERAGVKFADADLIGWPVQVVVGKRGVKEGVVEVKRRGESEKTKVPFATLTEALAFVKRAARNNKFSRTF